MDEVVKVYWAAFLASSWEQELPDEPADVFAFGNTPELADTLGELVARGVKSATSSALWAYGDGELLPTVGDLSIVTDRDGHPLCIIETTEVTIRSFLGVDAAFAHDEGEGDRSLHYWRTVHRTFFSEILPSIGHTFSEDMPVVCERFSVIYPLGTDVRR